VTASSDNHHVLPECDLRDGFEAFGKGIDHPVQTDPVSLAGKVAVGVGGRVHWKDAPEARSSVG